ncbi:MAG: HEAT repeat domain-containing protein [Planctomycetes bacterium]|nr:HEAT repeat domain-containing protein [Planctomycetota bacterium]
MSTEMPSLTCHCGTKFQPPAERKERRVNCPNCGAVIFLATPKDDADDDEEIYGIKNSDDEPAVKKAAGVEGIPDWLDDYRSSPNVKKADRAKTLALIDRLATANPTLDPLGAALYLACTHADAETSVAALTKVAASGHPAYAATAVTLLEFVTPRDAAGAQQVLLLLSEVHEVAAEELICRVLRQLGPTPIVQVRSLISLFSTRHASLYIWGVQCLALIGPPAKRAVDALLKAIKINSHPFRIAIIDALGVIGGEPERVVPFLMQTLKHEQVDYRKHSAQALGRFGAHAAGAVSVLMEAQKDPDEGVRQAAAKALSLIAAAPKGGATAVAKPASASAPSDTLIVACSCGKRLKAKVELAGKKVKCPACGGVLVVPVPAAAPASAQAPASPGPASEASEKECPTCWATVPVKAVLCVCCGYDFRAK